MLFGIVATLCGCTSTKEVSSNANSSEIKTNSNANTQQKETDQEGLKKAEERATRLSIENSEKIKQRQKKLKEIQKNNPSHKK